MTLTTTHCCGHEVQHPDLEKRRDLAQSEIARALCNRSKKPCPACFAAHSTVIEVAPMPHIGTVGSPPEREIRVREAIEIARAWNAPALIKQRVELLRARGYAIEAMGDAQERRIEEVSAEGYSDRAMSRAAARLQAAEAAVVAFDREHPEVAGWMEADESANVKQLFSQ